MERIDPIGNVFGSSTNWEKKLFLIVVGEHVGDND